MLPSSEAKAIGVGCGAVKGRCVCKEELKEQKNRTKLSKIHILGNRPQLCAKLFANSARIAKSLPSLPPASHHPLHSFTTSRHRDLSYLYYWESPQTHKLLAISLRICQASFLKVLLLQRGTCRKKLAAS